RSGTTWTRRSVRASGWHSGIRSEVRLAPITPASSATVRTSPLAARPSITRLSVSWLRATRASATARRAVAGLALTSTIRGRPVRSTWLRRRRSGRGGGLRSMVVLRLRDDESAVEPKDLDVGAGRSFVELLGNRRQGIGRCQRTEDVAALP